MTPEQINALVELYIEVKDRVSSLPEFEKEIAWQNDRKLEHITEQEFLCEAAFVIYNSGMRTTTIRNVWPALTKAFRNFNAPRICHEQEQVRREVRNRFNSAGKVNAVIRLAEMLVSRGWTKFRTSIARDGIDGLERIPYIGPVTKYHLAKSIGFDCCKPDRHLKRIANELSTTPEKVCKAISERTGDRVCVVDLVLWKWASTEPSYRIELIQTVVKP